MLFVPIVAAACLIVAAPSLSGQTVKTNDGDADQILVDGSHYASKIGRKEKSHESDSIEMFNGKVMQFESKRRIEIKTAGGEVQRFRITGATSFEDKKGVETTDLIPRETKFVRIRAMESPQGWEALMINPRAKEIGEPLYTPKPVSTNVTHLFPFTNLPPGKDLLPHIELTPKGVGP